MRPDKLRKLLQEMEERLARAEKSYAHDEHALRPLASTKREVRRYLSKVDSLRKVDIDSLNERVLRLPINDLGLGNLILGMKIGLNQLGPEDILEATPGQKLAAFSFGFDGDDLRIVDQPLRAHERDAEIAFAALEGALEHGEYVNQDLAATNASPRLKEAFERLQATMISHKNIVQIGSRAQICNRLVNGEIDELSPPLFGLLIGHIESVFSALAQFEDWRIYSENAAALNIDAGSVAKLADGTGQLLKQLRDEQSVDESVVHALETVKGWVEDSTPPDRRDVLSLSRSLENFWSVVTKSILAIGGDVVTAGRKEVAAAILAALLIAAPAIVPVIGKLPGGHWVETVYNYFKSLGPLRLTNSPSPPNESGMQLRLLSRARNFALIRIL